MQDKTSRIAALIAVAVVAGWVMVGAGQGPSQLPLEPVKERGASVTGALEGWYKTPDGGFSILVGYFNRNRAEPLDIPVGPNNRIEPGGPDMGQPTYFLPRRQWGVFSIDVPKDFGTKRLTWTIVANGETTSIPLSLNPAYEVEPYKEAGMGNTPPTLKFSPNGPAADRTAAWHRADAQHDGGRAGDAHVLGRRRRARWSRAEAAVALPSASRWPSIAGPGPSRSARCGPRLT